MIQFLHILFVLCFILLIIGFFIGNFTFLRLFNKIKAEEPAYLDSKINRYSYFDARSQFSFMVLRGKYQDLNNTELKKRLDRQRVMMIFHLGVTILAIAAFALAIILKHH